MNRINRLFQHKSGNVLSIYFTAGYPAVDGTPAVIKALANAGADMIEIGIPFSDPMADGPVIQKSSTVALKNGMSLKLLFRQLQEIRKEVDIPLLLMGYLNPVLQYGMERFCQDCAKTGIDGIILPDLPLEVFEGNSLLAGHNMPGQQASLHSLFTQNNLHNIFLISPQTSTERINKIDSISNSFIYMVSSSSTTGVRGSFTPEQTVYFERVRNMKLNNPKLIGFGISNHESFTTACNYASGAIIGSAFVRMLGEKGYGNAMISKFVTEIRQGMQEV